jgi:long-chain acyl-CoA synthetase
METLVSLAKKSRDNFSSRIAIRSQLSGINWSYDQLYENAGKVSGSLRNQGIGEGDLVSIVCENDGYFVAVNSGIHGLGAIAAPIDQNLNPSSLYPDYFRKLKPKLILADENNFSKAKKYCGDIPLLHFDQALSGKYLKPNENINPENICTTICSSGTTCDSQKSIKGVMLSHGNIASNIISARNLTTLVERERGEQGIYLAGLARHWHSFEYMIESAMLDSGSNLYFSDIQKFIKGKAAEINPHYAIMVPRAANAIMNEIKKQITKKGDRTFRAFEWFLEKSKNYHYELINNSKKQIGKYFFDLLGDRLFYNKIRKGLSNKLGNNSPLLIGGSAPLSLETQLFFYVMGIPIYQGYGLTETSPAICVNLPGAYRFLSSGLILPGIQVIIADTQQLESKRSIKINEDSKEGLILAKGDNIFKGYLDDEEATQNAFVDGWFNTEDLGYMKEGFLYVTGRNKDLICKSNGEKVNPAIIESSYDSKGLRLILVGNNCQNIGAFIVPEYEIASSLKSLGKEQVIKDICRNYLFNSKEKFGISLSPRNVDILLDFNSHPELVTGTMKVKRKLVEKHYEKKVKEMCN